MKIQRPNSINVNNPYQRQLQHDETQGKKTYSDQVKISKEALQLQESNQIAKERLEYVNDIKKLVDSGDDKVDHEQVVQKMLNFWGKGT